MAMIDSGVDINCIQERLIPSKYFEKSTERLASVNGTKIKIKYELNNAHVCHDNVYFEIPFVLIKNMTDKVILALPFINALYPFLVEHDEITTDPFRHKVKFKFASKFEIGVDVALNLIHAKAKHLNFLQQEVRHKKIAEQLSDKLLQSKIDNFQKFLIDDVFFDAPNVFWHKRNRIVDLLYDIINLSYIEDFPTNVLIQEPRIDFCQYFTNGFEGNTHSAKLLTITNYPNVLNDSLQESNKAIWINTTNKWKNNNNTYTYTTSKWIIMASSTKRRDKGKAPAQGYSQDKRLPAGQSFVMHEGASSGVKPSRSTSL